MGNNCCAKRDDEKENNKEENKLETKRAWAPVDRRSYSFDKDYRMSNRSNDHLFRAKHR